MKYFSILIIIYLSCACNNEKSKNYVFSLLNNHSQKQWNRIGVNGSTYKDGKSSDCIVFRNNNKFEHYNFYKNGSIERTTGGDVVQLESYRLISDSLMLFGNGYVEIKKLTEDTLVLSDPCSGNVNTYKTVEVDKRIK